MNQPDIQALLEDIANGKVEPEQAAVIIQSQYRPIATKTRTRTDYTPELLAEANRLHHDPNNWSIRRIAAKLCCDHATLRKKMREANYEIRTQKDSQRARRAMEKLTKKDVNGWDDPFLRTNGR